MSLSTDNKFKDVDAFAYAVTEDKIRQFNASLLFISHYASVSFESMHNYAKTYPFGVYKKDREGWVKWYEENKCNNIQVKSD